MFNYKKNTYMKYLVFILISMFSYFGVMAQDLGKLNKVQRDKYLVDLSTQVIKKFGPDYYRNVTPIITEGVFESDDKRSEIKNNIGRKYYEVTYSYDKSKEVLDFDFSAKVRIWKDNGEPCDVVFGNGYGKNFFFLSYKEQTDTRAIIEVVPYQQASNPNEDIWIKE